MTTIETALVTSAIPFFAVWFAIFNRFIPQSKVFSSYIQATAAGFIVGSILLELMPRLLNTGIQWSYILAFMIGFIFMLLINREGSSCCSGGSSSPSLISFLFPFTVEFFITAILIGIAAATNTSLSYMIAISFGLCNFVCGLSISSRLTKSNTRTSKRLIITILLSLIFPIISLLTVVLISYLNVFALDDLIAFAIALLLFLVVTDLLPEALSTNKKPAITIFFSAITFVFILGYFMM